MTAKRCKLCGGEPKYVHYAIPEQDYPDGWYESEYGREPMALFKRLECSKCGATVAQLVMTVDEAVEYWNEQKLLVRWGEEKVNDVEGDENALREIPIIEEHKSNRLIDKIKDMTAGETYDFLRWLLYDYGMRYTDTRTAVIEWIEGDEDE